MYKKLKLANGIDENNNVIYIDRNDAIIKDNSLIIPFDPANTDYQAYLAWVEAGGVPLPAEEQV